jgi:hypothetical protein
MSCSKTRKVLCGQETCSTCLERSFAKHPRASCWSQKNDKKPYEVLRCSNKKFWFDCEECGHELYTAPSSLSVVHRCVYCHGGKLCTDISCDKCHQKSFASHPMAIHWSLQNDKMPRDICKRSDQKCWFNCGDCGHSFQAALYSVQNDKHCPFCSNQRLCLEDCQVCFEKTCASHESMPAAWSPENALMAREVFLQSNKKIVFNCVVCHHTHTTTPNHYYHRNGSCPYCANHILCEDDCASCFQKSFASHPKVLCWSSTNPMTPRSVFQGSEQTAQFDCETCHSSFDSKLYNVLTGYWCPYCKKKTEAILNAFLEEEYSVKKQVRFDWCRFSETRNIMPFDVMRKDHPILIELDGNQHFIQVSNWGTPENIQKKDVEKIQYSILNGYSIIHLPQEDVWHDRFDWRAALREVMASLESADHQCVFLCSDAAVYDTHLQLLGDSVPYRIVVQERVGPVKEGRTVLDRSKSSKSAKNRK